MLDVSGGDIRVNVIVPTEAEVGKSINLKCEWSLSKGDALYSVKWYKDDHEFFRYVPDQHPKIQTFPLNGVYLDVSTLNANFSFKKWEKKLIFILMKACLI